MEFLAMIFKNVIPCADIPSPPSAEGFLSFSGFFLTPNFERMSAEKMSSPPNIFLTILSLPNCLAKSFADPLIAEPAPPTRPLPPSTSEIYLDANDAIIVFYLLFVILIVLFLLLSNSPINQHKCFFPKATCFQVQSNYTCGVAS